MIRFQTNNKPITKVVTKLESWWENLVNNIPNITVAVLVLVLSFYVAQKISSWMYKLIIKKIQKAAISNVISKATAVFIIVLGLILALSVLNLNEALASLLTGAGIAGAVVGLALQGTLSNTLSGIILSFKSKIGIGDWIETNGYSGEVMDINLKEVTLKSVDNHTVIIPNKMIIENPLKNLSLTNNMRVFINCGVAYDSNLEKVENLTKNTIRTTVEQIDSKKDIEFYYTEFGASSINFVCRFWIRGGSILDRKKAKSIAIKNIKKVFSEENISIPFPITTIHLKQPGFAKTTISKL